MNETEVLLYTSYLHIIGGIETFVINFIEVMSATYDVGVYCPKLPPEIAERIKKKAKLFTRAELIKCDTLIMVRMMDTKPKNIFYVNSIRMSHATKSNPSWNIIQDCDKVVHVSNASKSSFKSDGEVIHNPLVKSSKNALIFVSATRVPALDKGKNAERMLKLAEMLNKANISFLWFNFSDAPLQNAPKGFVNVGTFQEVQPFIKKADYLVQLSDQEGFGYSVLEALINNTAVICTPFETTKELGVVDGKNGYIVPFDMEFDVTRLLDVPKFKYQYDNKAIKEKWDKLLILPEGHKEITSVEVVVIVQRYFDKKLNKEMYKGNRFTTDIERANYLASLRLVRLEGVK